MRLLIFSFAVSALTFASCNPHDNIPNNAPAVSENQLNKTSSVAPKPSQPCVNLNTATAKELATLPGIGEVLAKRIIDYREWHGRLRRPEELIIIEGLSERKYRAIAELVCVD